MLTPPLPSEFINAILTDSPFGPSLLSALDTLPPTAVRINPRKSLETALPVNNKVPWNDQGFYLDHRPSYTLDPRYHAGAYYAQEAASMVIGSLVKTLPLGKNPCILDACAAPGGKTLAMADALPKEAVIIANEINRHRSNILSENLSKWGLDHVMVTQNAIEDFTPLASFFDAILVDAPCSGEGMFRKDPKARSEWNPSAPEDCSVRQYHLLDTLIGCLKPGGFLIYSTCTFNRMENEAQISRLLETNAFELVEWNWPESCLPGRGGIGVYFAPGYTETEGLYVAVLRKRGTYNADGTEPLENVNTPTPFPLVLFDGQSIYEEAQGFYLVSNGLNALLNKLQCPLVIKKRGAKICEKGMKSGLPHQDMALLAPSPILFPRLALSKHEALRYLRGETFPVASLPLGIYTVTYESLPLGFIKHLGNRFNNLYPKDWRIRMQLK
jgi:16S rRNA C967 or C1407 C5-methylase (RsmB/RsmF family)/NOL1/NOP2/fmu family ribosome biogenesis protein